MRSRYSAFVVGDAAYLLASWHKSTRPAELELDDDVCWLRLLIEDTSGGTPFDKEGEVTFTAIARTSEGRFEQRERSRFVKDPAWQYLDGVELA